MHNRNKSIRNNSDIRLFYETEEYTRMYDTLLIVKDYPKTIKIQKTLTFAPTTANSNPKTVNTAIQVLQFS